MKRINLIALILLLTSLGSVYSDCVISQVEYHCVEGICVCSVGIDNTDSCYNDTWSQNGSVIIITNPYTPAAFEVYNYSSGVGTLESHDYLFDVSTLECNNG
ncbi:MAG: hypothetical protein IMZ53_03480, partial [Thermoplasmata archaeon]|nr:hypothetical protein [Thermoplasmata archaeon]